MNIQQLTAVAAVIVLITWVSTTVDGMITGNYEGLQIVTPIMVMLAGYLFARDFIGVRRRKDEEE